MFGRSPILPIDMIFGLDTSDKPEGMQKSYAKFVDEWEHAVKQAYDIVRCQDKKASERNSSTTRSYGVLQSKSETACYSEIGKRGGQEN